MTHDRLCRLQNRVVLQAARFRHPAAYAAGVRAAFEALRAELLVGAGSSGVGPGPDGVRTALPVGSTDDLPPAEAWFG